VAELKPLQGKRVLVTRARSQARSLSEKLRAVGAEPVEFPTIRIVPAEDTGPLDRAIAHIDRYDWIIFTSQNAIKPFWGRLKAAGKDVRSLAGVRIGAIGPATAAGLEAIGLRADFVPYQFVAEAIVAEIGDVAGMQILLPRADIARKVLAAGLRDKGARVDEVVAYRTVAAQPPPEIWWTLLEEGVDIVTFTASSTVRSFVAMLDGRNPGQVLGGAMVACIGPITAYTAEALGLHVDIVAEEHTMDGLVEAIVGACEGSELKAERES